MSQKRHRGGGGGVKPPPEHLKRKVAIVGFTDSRALAPFTDPEFSIWGLNALFLLGETVPRADLWFDLHPTHLIEADEKRTAWYKGTTMPLLLQDVHADFPTSDKFPAQKVREEFRGMFVHDPGEFRYFTSSIAWMMAYALFAVDGLEELHLYGVDMAQVDEYRHQRACVEFWLGIAMGRGVKVHVPDTCDILKATHEYGYGTDSGLRAKLQSRVEEYDERLAQIATQVQAHKDKIRILTDMKLKAEGSQENARWIHQSWCVADHLSMKPDHPDIDGGNGAALDAAGDEMPAAEFEGLGLVAEDDAAEQSEVPTGADHH